MRIMKVRKRERERERERERGGEKDRERGRERKRERKKERERERKTAFFLSVPLVSVCEYMFVTLCKCERQKKKK